MSSMDEAQVQDAARRYGPMLDALQQGLENEFGPVSWAVRSDPGVANLHGGGTALRVGAIHATGVPVHRLDLPAISAVTNHVLREWGFPEQPPITGSPSGELICEATDDSGARFTLLIKMTVNAWVDLPD